MKTWIISALAYLVIVIGSYYAYAAIASPPAEDVPHSNMEHNE